LAAAEIMRTREFVAIMDKYPINRGHTLVIPIKHYENLLEMPVQEVAALYSIVPSIARSIVFTVKADGFNIGQNNGLAANQIVPHVHVHIVPRFHDDSPDGRWPARQVANIDELAKIDSDLREYMRALEFFREP
jgi:histidine triad (HIT) family protein